LGGREVYPGLHSEFKVSLKLELHSETQSQKQNKQKAPFKVLSLNCLLCPAEALISTKTHDPSLYISLHDICITPDKIFCINVNKTYIHIHIVGLYYITNWDCVLLDKSHIITGNIARPQT
jgi:hypothetical protein